MIQEESKIDEHKSKAKNAFEDKNKENYTYSVHIDEVLKEILAYHNKEGYLKFEEISMFIRKKLSKLSFNHKITPYIPKSFIDMTEFDKNIIKQIENKKFKSLTKIPNTMDDILEKAKF